MRARLASGHAEHRRLVGGVPRVTLEKQSVEGCQVIGRSGADGQLHIAPLRLADVDAKARGRGRRAVEIAERLREELDYLREAAQMRLYDLMLQDEPLVSVPKPIDDLTTPRLLTMKIHPDKIREVIGKGGSVIQAITKETGTQIDIQDDGTITIASVNGAAGQAAKARIEQITSDVEPGRIYEGKVAKIMDFGAFVTILPGKDGLVHVSQISNDRVEKVSDALKEGDVVKVKVLEVDKQGRIRLAGAHGYAGRAGPGHSQGNGQHAADMLVDTSKLSLDEIVKTVGYVPQDPGLLLFQDTLAQELTFTRNGHALPADRPADQALLAGLGLAHLSDHYPRDLSGGERQRAALAAILVADPQVLLLDEPTRGLDYQQKAELVKLLRSYRQAGKTIIMATHDVELVAGCADRVILLAEGQVVLDAPTRIAMSESLVFASQINKLLRDPAFLTVDAVSYKHLTLPTIYSV